MEVFVNPKHITKKHTLQQTTENRREFVENYIMDEYQMGVFWTEEPQTAPWWMPPNTREAVKSQLKSIAYTAVEESLMEFPLDTWEEDD